MEPMELMARVASMVAFAAISPRALVRPVCSRLQASQAHRAGPRCAPHPLLAEHERAIAPADTHPAPTPASTCNAKGTASANSSMREAVAPVPLPEWRPRDGGTRIPWADLMRHGFDIDVLRCPRCAGTMSVIALVHDRAECRRYMEHASIPLRDHVPQRAWDPVPIDPLPPDDTVA